MKAVCSITPKAVVTALCVVFANVVAPAAAAVLRVPQDYPAIQTAIDVAMNGDTVLVSPGVYTERIDFRGKAITVASVDGASATIIDGQSLGTVVTIVANPGEGPVLRGFTVTRGYGFPFAGGIYTYGGPAVVEENIITDNFGCLGGGISAEFSSATIRNNLVSNNRPNCVGGTGGGGVNLGGAGTARVVGNVISGNISAFDGGGISLFAAGEPVISGNVITGNVTGDSVPGSGGGISLANASNAVIVNNIIAANASRYGGGISWLVPSGEPGPNVINNTIAFNDSLLGTAVYADGFDAQARLTNNILVGSGMRWVVECGTFNDLNPPVISYNDVFNVDGTSRYGGACVDQTGVNGNIAADPLFVDRANGNFHIMTSSPAVDAGQNTGAPRVDIDAEVRPTDGNGDGSAVVDVGADEVVQIDTTAPLISVPGAIFADATSPAGAMVTYVVSVTDDHDPFPSVTCEPASGSVFSLLQTTVHCTASDATGNVSHAAFDVIVKDAYGQLQDAIELVEASNLGGLGTSLIAKLQRAQTLHVDRKMKPSCGDIASFVNEVAAQDGKALTAEQVEDLTIRAIRAMAVIGC